MKAGTDPGHISVEEMPDFGRMGQLGQPSDHISLTTGGGDPLTAGLKGQWAQSHPQAAAAGSGHTSAEFEAKIASGEGLDVLPGSTAGAGGGFVQMFPTAAPAAGAPAADPAPTAPAGPAGPAAPATPAAGDGIDLDIDFGGGANGGGFTVHASGLNAAEAEELIDRLSDQHDPADAFGQGTTATVPGHAPVAPGATQVDAADAPEQVALTHEPAGFPGQRLHEQDETDAQEPITHEADPHAGFAAQDPAHAIDGLVT